MKKHNINGTLNIVTSNKGKFREYQKKLCGNYSEVKMLNIGYPEIQADDLEKVVNYAVDHLRDHTPLLIDDSGLFIDSLKGFPGVYSSFVMETIGCEGILRLMKDKKERKARFECVIGFLADKDQQMNVFKGESHGLITKEKKGLKGFGYDPIFKPKECDRTFAEMDPEEKNKLSHRGRAVEKLIDFLVEN